MRSKLALWAPLFLSSSVALAQTPPNSPTFEVASVKPSPPMDPHGSGKPGWKIGSTGGPGTRDPGQYTATNITLRMLITQAYGVKRYQVSGPAWIDAERYEILAKVPPETTKEQFNLMLQNLLAERFQLKLHREKKELPMYALVVGKNGPKLKESEPPPAPAEGAQESPKDLPPPPQGPIKMGKDGFPEMPAVAKGRQGFSMMMTNGRFRMKANSTTMTQLANMLENQVGRPVVDETGLTGKYDFELDFAPDEGMRVGGMMGGGGPMGGGMMIMVGPGPGGPPPPPPGGGGADFGGPSGSLPPSMSEGAPSLFTAVQQLGLKLDAKKAPVDLIVIDGGEKTPTEN